MVTEQDCKSIFKQLTATCCHLEKETNPYKLRQFYFSHARYLDTSIKDNQFMNDLFGRSNNQTEHGGKIPSFTEPHELGSARRGAACKDENTAH